MVCGIWCLVYGGGGWLHTIIPGNIFVVFANQFATNACLTRSKCFIKMPNLFATLPDAHVLYWQWDEAEDDPPRPPDPSRVPNPSLVAPFFYNDLPIRLFAPAQPPFWPLKMLLFQVWGVNLPPQVRHNIFALVGWKPLLGRQWA